MLDRTILAEIDRMLIPRIHMLNIKDYQTILEAASMILQETNYNFKLIDEITKEIVKLLNNNDPQLSNKVIQSLIKSYAAMRY